MEMNQYKCPICGFVHFVPAYWSSFAPDPQVDLSHISFETGEDCTQLRLLLQKNSDD